MAKTKVNRRQVGHPLIVLVDLCSIAIGVYGLLNISRIDLPPNLKGAGHWQFLTNLSLLASIITFVIGLVGHLIKSERIFTIKNTIHTIVFVAEGVVTAVYWPLRLFFLKYLINDKVVRLKLAVDLSIHFMPFVSLAIDFFFFMPNFQMQTKSAFLSFIALTSAYWIWLNSIIDFENGGIFPYAFLNVESPVVRGILFWGIGLSAFVQFLWFRFLYKRFVKPEIVEALKQD